MTSIQTNLFPHPSETCPAAVESASPKADDTTSPLPLSTTEKTDRYVTDFAKHLAPFTDKEGMVTVSSITARLSDLQESRWGKIRVFFLAPFLFVGSAKTCPFASVDPNQMHKTGFHPPIETGAYDSNGMYQPQVLQKIFDDYGVTVDQTDEKVLTEKAINRFLDDRHAEAIKDIPWYRAAKKIKFWFIRKVMAPFELPILHSMWGVSRKVNNSVEKVLTLPTLENCLINFAPMVEARIAEIQAKKEKPKAE